MSSGRSCLCCVLCGECFVVGVFVACVFVVCVLSCWQASLQGDHTNDAEVNEGDAPVLQHEEVACVHVCVKGAAPYDARRPRVERRNQRGLGALYRVGTNCVEINERPIINKQTNKQTNK